MSITAFRTEITDTVRGLFELNKLKIVLVSGLLAVAFGIGSASKAGDYSYLTLTLVPFICLYVDFQFYHGLAKIFVLARFLAESPAVSEEACVVQAYETFVDRVRRNSPHGLFSFESYAQIGSSILLSLTCPVLGVLAISTAPPATKHSGAMAMVMALGVSAVFGTILVSGAFYRFTREIRRMRDVPMASATTPRPLARSGNPPIFSSKQQ